MRHIDNPSSANILPGDCIVATSAQRAALSIGPEDAGKVIVEKDSGRMYLATMTEGAKPLSTNLAAELAGTATGLHIILCVGESHIAGRGTLDTSIDVAHPQVMQYGCASADGRYQTIFSGVDPLHQIEGVATAKNGPSTWFARAYLSQHPTAAGVLLLPLGQGSTTIVNASTAFWRPGDPVVAGTGGSGTTAAITLANAAVTNATELFPGSSVVGILMQIGANDAAASVPASTFRRQMAYLIQALRAQVTGASNAWVSILGLPKVAIAANPSNTYAAIAAALPLVAADVGNAAYTEGIDGYCSDNIHYTAPGSRITGTAGALALRRLLPTTSMPTPSAVPVPLRLKTMTGAVVEGGSATGWTYSSTGGTYAGTYASPSIEYMPHDSEGVVEWPLPAETSATKSLIVSIVAWHQAAVFSTVGYRLLSITTDTLSLKYRLAVTTGGFTNTVYDYAVGDTLRIRREGFDAVCELRRTGSATWLELVRYTDTERRPWWINAAFYGTMTLAGMTIVGGV